jgi:hypothetical protein
MTTLHRLLLTAAAAAAVAVPLLGAQAPAPSNFRPLEFLVGHCWIGTFPDGKQTDEHCFEWVYDRKFVRDRHVVRPAAGGAVQYEGESLYQWDAKAKHIAFNYWNVLGQMSTGTLEETAEGIVFPQKLESATGTTEMKTIWTRPVADSYHVWVGEKKGAAWKELWTMDLRRKN